MRSKPLALRDPLRPADWYPEARRHTLCRLGLHSRSRVYRFNGGRGAWLCRYCRVMLPEHKVED